MPLYPVLHVPWQAWPTRVPEQAVVKYWPLVTGAADGLPSHPAAATTNAIGPKVGEREREREANESN